MPDKHENTTLAGLMAVLLGYTANTPVWIYAVTAPKCNKFSRADKDKPKEEKTACPYLSDDPLMASPKGEPGIMIRKHCYQLVRINDDYEMAVRRRFIKEQREEGRTAPMEDGEEFVAEKPAWGTKLSPDFVPEGEKVPQLFEWHIPKYTTAVKYYMAVRPVQCLKVWYQWEYGPKKGQILTDEEVKYAKLNYFDVKDEEMEAMRQGVEKAIPWRKYLFDSLRAMTIDGTRYEIVDTTMPEVPPEQRESLMKMLDDRKTEIASVAAVAADKAKKKAEKDAKKGKGKAGYTEDPKKLEEN